MSTDVVAILVAIFTGGFGVAVVNGWVSHKKGIRDSDVAADQNALQGYKDLAAEYKDDLAALKVEIREKDAENDARFDRIERELDKERNTRWAAVQYARSLLALIVQHVPGITVPPVPEPLAEHIIIPPRKDPEP